MAALSKQLVQLVLQFLNEENFEEAVHMLEQETGLFFDLNYFERLMMAGNFDHAVEYLSGFINLYENRNSMKILFEIRKQKYLEALDRKDLFRAVEMLRNDLKVFKEISPEVYVQLMELLTLNDFRENEQLKDYSKDTMVQRNVTFLNIKKLIDTNTDIQQKMTFPNIDKSRLRLLINQSINWQHHKCKSTRSNPDIRTIFVDHTCEPPNGAPTPSPANSPLMASTSNRMAFPPIPSTYIPFQAGVAPPVNYSLTGWPAHINLPVPLGAAATAAVVPNQNTGAKLKQPRTRPPTKGGSDYEYNTMKRFRATEINEVPNINLMDAVGHGAGRPEISERVLPNLVTSVDSNRTGDIKQNIPEGAIQCRLLKLQDPLSTGKIVRLQYTNSGSWLLALDTNAKHKLWKWTRADKSYFQATTRFPPEFWQPTSGRDMRNDTNDRSPDEIDPCMAVTKNSSYLVSCSGGEVSLFNMKTFERMFSFAAPPPAATFLAFHPKDCNIVAIGREDGTILIFNCRTEEMKGKLKGHENRITGLAFSEVLNVLVSSGADAQLCVWGIDTWEKQKTKSVQSEAGISSSSLGNTRVQFHNDQVHLLVVQDNQIAIYDAYQLERLFHWSPQDSMTAPISSATYSCDCLLVYASFSDGSVGVFDANVLKPCRRIAPSALIPGVSSGNTSPFVIAAHPREPNQFAIGLTDGGVHVIEPAESEGKWVVGPSDNVVDGSNDIVNNKSSKLPPM